MKVPLVVTFFLVGLTILSLAADEITVSLSPVPAYELGTWAAGKRVFRLYASLERPLKRQGPEPAMALFGLLELGGDEYPLMFAVLTDNSPYLAVDFDGDSVFSESEGHLGTPLSPEEWLWQLKFTVHDKPYELSVVWPAGRGFLFLIGQTAMEGLLELAGGSYKVVLVDADVNGNYGDEADFYVVDVDGDGVLRGGEGGHESFAMDEPFTIGKSSFKVAEVSTDGSIIKVIPTEYVPPKVPLYIGAKAPEFSFKSLRGKEVSLAQYRGKVVLLDFWASWCLPCVVATPKMKALYDAYHDRGLEIIGINLDLSREQALAFIEHFELPWPQYWDGKGYDSELAKLFRVQAIPTLYLIDQEGVIRGKWLGLAEEEVKEKVEELFGALELEDKGRDVGSGGEAHASPSPILSVEVPAKISVSEGFEGTVPLRIKLENASTYEAKELVVKLSDLPPGATAEPKTVGELGAGERIFLSVPLRLQPLGAGKYSTKVEVSYSYCPSEDVCFKFTQKTFFILIVNMSGTEATASEIPEVELGGDPKAAHSGVSWFLIAGAGALILLLFLVLLG